MDKPILEMHGLVKEEEKAKVTALTRRECPRCGNLNPATAQYCNCGMILNEQVRLEKMRQEQAQAKESEELRKQLDEVTQERDWARGKIGLLEARFDALHASVFPLKQYSLKAIEDAAKAMRVAEAQEKQSAEAMRQNAELMRQVEALKKRLEKTEKRQSQSRL